MDRNAKIAAYRALQKRLLHLLDGSVDWTAAMATVACELHSTFETCDWTGFYRTVRPGHLQVGPYQGGHGCIDIPFERGVCGAAARTATTQVVADVSTFEGHIACSSTTRSEIAVPVLSPSGTVIAVLDVDSDQLSAFDDADRVELESLCRMLGDRFGTEAEQAIVR